MTAQRIPPQLPLLFQPSAESVLRDAQRTIQESTAVWDDVVKNVSPEQANIENTIIPIAHIENETMAVNDVVYLFATTHPSEEIRVASKAAKRLTDNAEVDRYLRNDMFTLVDAVLKNTDEALTHPETYRFLVKHHAKFAENGCDLKGAAKDKFESDKKKLKSITQQYLTNLDDDQSGLWFSQSDLDGLPSSFVESLKTGDGENRGKYWVNMKKSHHERILKYATSEQTRMQYFIAHQSRMPANIPLCHEIFLLRHSLARQMGWQSWAKFKMSNKMMTSPDAVRSTLLDFKNKSSELKKKQIADLLALKKADAPASNDQDTKLFLWDVAFYKKLLQEKSYSIAAQSISEYFELRTVISNILSLYGRLFEIQFEIVTCDVAQYLHGDQSSATRWHDDVFFYSVWDLRAESSFLGYIYFDPHPRQGKYTHTGHFNLQKGFERQGGGRKYPCAALITNQAKAVDGKPSLLSPNEVRAIFHEVGHGLHNLLSVTKFARFHGPKVDRDFVETPSILFEFFLWTPDRLREVSCHYSHVSTELEAAWKTANPTAQGLPPQKLPDEMIEAVIYSAHDTLGDLRNLHFGLYDLAVHDPPSTEALEHMNICATYNQMWFDTVGVHGGEAVGDLGWEWAHGESVVRLIMGDQYDAGYYAYIMGRMWALDIFETFFEKDTMNTQEARRYREMLLKPGGSQSGWKTLTEYLGREPNPGPYYRWLKRSS
ncbi:hypothetical protein BD289DRAFT_361531 [Coniella lustricola]|uniref:Peptidase M3A/M3B catalytic domain-containing protein n=1 Tax=Coniella lustricola TaxID=2025994 RepID=A0A2T3AI48_9PEZI|nr:hypothetical protein BD289DRAFT_361531 [Coniella lustricola]